MTADELCDRLGDMPPGTEVVFKDMSLGLVGIESADLKLIDPLVVTLGHGAKRRRVRMAIDERVPRAVVLS